VRVLTWGGLRGGISVALALSLRGTRDAPPDHGLDLVLVMTYVVVVFSIGVQGLTIGAVMRASLRSSAIAALRARTNDAGSRSAG
jgi:CPA1 family monovalent cation:H+ antiporter